jgi:serine/threonine protein kinase/formylglycine-generating enzyme required for sulfatase activity
MSALLPDDPTLTAGGPLRTGDIFADRYEILQHLGTGGTSSVYQVRDRLVGELIALKLIHQHAAANPKLLENFKRELSVARKLLHRNVVRIFDIGEHQGQFYISMEYVEGRSLADLLKERGRLTVQQFFAIFEQFCDALGYVHAQNVIHRDIKPHNVMAHKDGTLKLMDFGVARDASSLPTMGIVLGTPSYMAPEQMMGKPLTQAVDIFASGAMFYEMLTGKKPFQGLSLSQRVVAPAPDFPPDTTDVPLGVQEAIRQSLEPDPSKRFPNVEAMVQAFRAGMQSPVPRKDQNVGMLLQDGPADPAVVVPIFARILRKLQEIHDAGRYHPELAPRRVYLTPDGFVEIRTTTVPEATSSVAIKEPKYSPPDVFALGDPAAHAAADVYAVGFMLYEVLLGRKRFHEQFASVQEIGGEIGWLEWHADLNRKARPLAETVQGVALPLSQTLERMMEKRVEHRIKTLHEAIASLESPGALPVFPSPRVATQQFPPVPDPSQTQSGIRFDPGGLSIDWRFLAAIGLAIAGLVAVYLLTRPTREVQVATKAQQSAPQKPGPELPRLIDTATGELVLVGEGDAILGAKGTEKSERVAPFYIDRTEVTNAQYRAFAQATNRAMPPAPEWDRRYFDKDEYPVVNVTWQDAAAYAAWAGKRLPTQAEWEKAARGYDGRTYPWGNWTQATAANLTGTDDGHRFTAPVGAFPYDESPFGAIDMAGNVSEWVNAEVSGAKMVRGGNYLSEVEQVPASFAAPGPTAIDPKKTSPVGFRCAADVEVAAKLKDFKPSSTPATPAAPPASQPSATSKTPSSPPSTPPPTRIPIQPVK